MNKLSIDFGVNIFLHRASKLFTFVNSRRTTRLFYTSQICCNASSTQ